MNRGYIVKTMRYGERLRQARKQAKLTQAELAEKIGGICSQENISKLERGDATGSAFTIQFAAACGVDPMWLAVGRGAEHPPKRQVVAGTRVAWGPATPTDRAIRAGGPEPEGEEAALAAMMADLSPGTRALVDELCQADKGGALSPEKIDAVRELLSISKKR